MALLLIPQSLSYASGLAKLEPIIGLYTCFVPLILYGILGTSRQISVGPEALISLLVGNAITQTSVPGVPVGMEERLHQAILLSFMVGVITLFLGLLRFGFLDSVLSRALLRGFITAVACVILIEQMPALLGIHVEHHDSNSSESPFQKLQQTLYHLSETNWATVCISICSVGFLFGFAKVKHNVLTRIDSLRAEENLHEQGPFYRTTQEVINDDDEEEDNDVEVLEEPIDTSQQQKHISPLLRFLFYIPEILIVVFFTTLVCWMLDLNKVSHVDILGEASLNGGFQSPSLPSLKLSKMKTLITPAILISILGFVESIVVSKYFGSKYNYSVSANRELVAFGTLNLLGSFFNAFPAFASIARSRVNDTAGARTQLAGIVTGVIILFTILFLLPAFYYLPKAVMASIVVVAAAGLLEMHDLQFMIRIRAWTDLLLSLMTFLITLFWSVEAGTLISISLSLIMVVKHSTTPKISILGKVVELDPVDNQQKIKYKPLQEIYRNPTEHHRQPNSDHDILIVRIEESLFFGNTGQLKDRLRRAEAYGGWLHIHPSEEEQRPVDTRVTTAEGKEYSRVNTGSSSNSNDNNNIQLPSVESSRLLAAPRNSFHSPPLRAVIFDIENMTNIDASAVQTLIEAVQEYQKREIKVLFVKMREGNKLMFLRSGLLGEVLGSDHFLRKISDAIQFIRQTSSDKPPDSYSSYSVL